MSQNPFDELSEAIQDACDEVQEAVVRAQQDESESKRERAKYFVVDVKFIANSQKELREYLEANDDIAGSSRIVKGSEIVAKRKSVYTF